MSALIDAGISTAVRHDLVRWSSPSLISHRVHYRFVQAIIWLGPTLIWAVIFPCSSPWGKSHVKPFSSSTLPLGHDWIKAAFLRADGEALNYPASGKAGNGNKSNGCDAGIKGRVCIFPSSSLGKLQPLQKDSCCLGEFNLEGQTCRAVNNLGKRWNSRGLGWNMEQFIVSQEQWPNLHINLHTSFHIFLVTYCRSSVWL